jgi:F-type H+-transporting ATPase subunit O
VALAVILVFLKRPSDILSCVPVSQQVPAALYGGTGNYASALFLSAAKANSLDRVESEIRDIVAATKKSPMFSQFLKDSSVPKETRVKAVTDIFGEGFSDVTKNFLCMLPIHSALHV